MSNEINGGSNMISSKKKELGKFIGTIVCGIGVGVLVSNFLVCRVTVEGVSMNPTYATGDILLVSKRGIPDRGKIVTFNRKGKNYIKRIIALPGDTLSIKDSKVYVNGNMIQEDYINEKVFNGGLITDFECTLNESEFFVMGDNRNYSIDSRSFGVICKDEIIGIKLIDLG